MSLLFKDLISGRNYQSIGRSAYGPGIASLSQAASGHYRHPGSPVAGAFCGGSLDAFAPTTASFSSTAAPRLASLGDANITFTFAFTGCRIGDVYICGPSAAQTAGTCYHLVAE